ncbi:hypothetical protein K8B83_18815 [Shewanella inventionis]|uniref:hypothetical protein n=1 Tax=Shewanella inventionis TaxID=1738770 RepID=UPI001CBE2E3B|nr:hypothetical protein [Shewanella inventionis]UAL42844.1 hypothetical protein K8B83_18815 [Shewanella inventionis]
MSNIATLSVSLVANTARFSQALVSASSSAKKHSGDIGKHLSNIGSTAGGVMAAGVTLGLGAVTALGAAIVANTIDTAKNVKEQVNLARQIGVNVNQYRALTTQLSTFGVSADDAYSALKDLNLKVSELAITGGGAFKDFTDTVNVDLKSWNSKSAIEQLSLLDEATSKMSDNNRRQFADALGSDALLKVLDALKASGKSVTEVVADYKAMGGFVTDTDISLLSSAYEMWTKLGTQIGIIRERFAVAFAPMLEPIMKMASDYLTEIESKEGGLRKWAFDSAKTMADAVFDVAEFLVTTFKSIYTAIIGVHNAWADMYFTDAEPIKIELTTSDLEKQLKDRTDMLVYAEQRLQKALDAKAETNRVIENSTFPSIHTWRSEGNDKVISKWQDEVKALKLEVTDLESKVETSVNGGVIGGLKSAKARMNDWLDQLNKDIDSVQSKKGTTDLGATTKGNDSGSAGGTVNGTGRKDALTEYNAIISSAIGVNKTIENSFNESQLKLNEYVKNGYLTRDEFDKAQAILTIDRDKQLLDARIQNLNTLGLTREANTLQYQSELDYINKLESLNEISNAQATEARIELGNKVAAQERSYAQEKIENLNAVGLADKARTLQMQNDLQLISDMQAEGLLTEQEANDARVEMGEALALERANTLESIGLESEALAIKNELEMENLKQLYDDKLITQQEYLDAKAEMENEHLETQQEVWVESLSGFQEDMWGMWESISSGVADSFTSMMMNGDDFGKSMKNVFKQMAVSYVAEKIKMFLIDKMYAMIAGKSNAQVSAAKGTEKVAEAGLNALTSFAAAPWPINLGAPAFSAMISGLAAGYGATMTSAAVSGASAVGQFHDGGTIPYDGTFYLQKDEVVVPRAKGAAAITALEKIDTATAKTEQPTQQPVNVNVTITATDSKSFVDQMNNIEGYFNQMVYNAINQ